MEVEEFITKKRELYAHLFEFVDSKDDSYLEFKELILTLKNQNILTNKSDSINLVMLLIRIFDNHQRTPEFISKIAEVFKYIIQNNQAITNQEIFHLCESNKYLLLHLLDLGVIKPEESLMTPFLEKKDSNIKNCYFFYEQIKNFIDKEKAKNIEYNISEIYQDTVENFAKKYKNGENDSYICTLIQSDSVEEFISFLNRTNISPSSKIPKSIFETNPFLIDKQPTLMEYSAFFGSIEIFRYLFMSNAKLTPSLWLYVVHGRNPDMIHFLEENRVKPNDDIFEDCIIESVKCHHNDVSDYIIGNLFKYTRYGYENNITGHLVPSIIECHNYNYYPTDLNSFFENKSLSFSKKFKISQICPQIKKITIPSSITSIGDYVFDGCSLLENVSIPSSVTSIGDYAFKGCSLIKEISIPSSVKSIGDYAFKGCPLIKEISIPSSVRSIGVGAFDSESLKITIQSTLMNYCINGLKNTKKLEIIGNIKTITEGFFSDCTSVEEIILPETINSIEKYAFKNCMSLKKMSIPSLLTKISTGTFSGCSSITEIEIPSSIISIEDSVFMNCRSLTQITIPSSVTSIGHSSFYNCSSLKQITIPSSVISIEYSCFKGCQNLKQVEILSPINEIKSNMFFGCSSLKQIKIPDSVTQIGSCCFESCSSLEMIEIPSSVLYIEMNAFYKCTLLKDIIFNCPITKIKANTFGMCTSLQKVVLPSTVTCIENNAFTHCTSLKMVSFPSTIKEIDKNAFLSCKSLKKASIPFK